MAETKTVVYPTQPLALQGRVAIVTGGSRGIGKAISLHLASLGADVVINYTSNSAQAEQLASQINANSSAPRAVLVIAGISDPEQVEMLFDKAESAFNAPLYVLVNSAGVVDTNCPLIADTTVEGFDYVINVNVLGHFWSAKKLPPGSNKGG